MKLSLGSADGIDADRARRLGQLARAVRAPIVSEHVAFTRAGPHEIGHLTPLPRTRAAIRTVARNVAAARRHLPDVPLLLENVACTLAWPDDEMDEPTFYAEVADATGCPLLLDVANVYANALNGNREPLDDLAAYPLDRVAMIHVAGGASEHGFYFDTHAEDVPSGVIDLLREFVRRRGPVPVLLERDASYPAFRELVSELQSLRQACMSSLPAQHVAPGRPTSVAAADADSDLADRQRQLASTLTGEGEAPLGFADIAVRRTREVLLGKRVDEAFALLPTLRAHERAVRGWALELLRGQPRPAARAAWSDAWVIATAALEDERFAEVAAVEALVLRARLHRPRRAGRPARARWGPFVGRVSTGTEGKSATWVWKGLGRSAPVKLWTGGQNA